MVHVEEILYDLKTNINTIFFFTPIRAVRQTKLTNSKTFNSFAVIEWQKTIYRGIDRFPILLLTNFLTILFDYVKLSVTQQKNKNYN